MRDSKYPSVSIEPDAFVRGCTLEFSSKPFFRKDDAYLERLFTETFRTYRQLLKHAGRVSILWWLSEGTDILEYDGDMSRRIEWAKWQGFAHTVDNGAASSRPATLYTADPVELTYGDVRRIASLMKKTCADVLGKELYVIVPFDPGSEFCISPFRYVRHTELLMGRSGGFVHCIDALARFHADPARFAAYPDGIPEGTVFGEFLGRQAQAYLTDMGMDGIWLSNSFGFGRSPYASAGTGAFFDGTRFSQNGNAEVRDGVMEFWKLFRAGCPGFEVRCRGTDFTVGVNMVNHASPYRELYKDNAFNITPPPNTPWSALTHNHGVSIAGYLTQNAPFPGDFMPLRFYTTDVFFCNNPWFDRWDRSPHDIYLNASQCVFNPDGTIRTVNELHVEGIDGSWGEMPSEIPDETIPHFKRALALRPDAPPPLLWVYPFDEYNECVFGAENRMSEPYGGDFSIIGAINQALPIGGAVTTAALPAARRVFGEAFPRPCCSRRRLNRAASGKSSCLRISKPAAPCCVTARWPVRAPSGRRASAWRRPPRRFQANSRFPAEANSSTTSSSVRAESAKPHPPARPCWRARNGTGRSARWRRSKAASRGCAAGRASRAKVRRCGVWRRATCASGSLRSRCSSRRCRRSAGSSSASRA